MSKTVVVFFDLGGVLCKGESLNGRDYLIFRIIYEMPLEEIDALEMSKNPPTETEIKEVIMRCHRLYEQDLFNNLINAMPNCNLFFGIATNSPKEVTIFTDNLQGVEQELVITSSLTGVSKPQVEFFEKMVEISQKYNPDEIFFVDDKKNIVATANFLPKITALQFDNTKGCSLFEFVKNNLDKLC